MWARVELERGLANGFEQLAGQLEEKRLAEIRPIIATNLERGRVENYLRLQRSQQPETYVFQVADLYERYEAYIYRLQVEKEAALWEELACLLRQWAYGFLERQFLAPQRKAQWVMDCVSDATLSLLDAHFPYDVEFEPWACVLMRNTCRKYLSERMQPVSVPAKETVPVDSWDSWPESFANPAELEASRRRELRYELLGAIEELASDARRQFIHLYYLEQHTFKEISRKMNRSAGTLYKLHFDALNDLRQVWHASTQQRVEEVAA